MKILFLAARFPYPLHRGDQTRAFHQLRFLAARHRVTLLTFASEAIDAAGRKAVRELCEDVVTVPLTMRSAALGLARAAASGLPAQAGLYQQPLMQRAVRDRLENGAFDLVHVQLARMAPYVEDAEVPRFVDLVDALSLGMRRRSGLHQGPVAWLADAEARRLLAYERRLCTVFEGACVTSAVDQGAIGGPRRPAVVPNGVDRARFPFGSEGHASRVVLFGGNLGYFANVDAASWFAGEILPRVRRLVPQARFRVVGARPASVLRRLARRDAAVELVGPVDDMAAALRSAAVAVAPIRAAAGQQTKVLEAMAVGVPVVATSMAAEGLGAEARTALSIVDAVGPFAEAVVRLLENAEEAAAQARRGHEFVTSHHDWERSGERLEACHAEAVRARVTRPAS